MGRCLLNDAGLPDNFWCYAVQHSTNILNVLPTRLTTGNLTLHEAFIGKKPSIVHFRIFGCKAYTHIPKKKRDKFASTSLECMFIGYAENRKAYCLYHKPTRRVLESRDVTFDEGIGIQPSRITVEVGTPSTNSTNHKLDEPVEQIIEDGTIPEEEDAPE
jgi:hypothetical protein